MNKTNLKIARELNRIAKDLVALVPHGGHSSKFTTDSTDPKLVQEIQNILDDFRNRYEAYVQVRRLAYTGANDMQELYKTVFDQVKKNSDDFKKQLATDPALRMIKEAKETLERVGQMAAKNGATLKASIAGMTMTVFPSERGSDRLARQFEQGVKKARLLEKEMSDYQKLARKYITELSSHVLKEVYEKRNWYLSEAEDLRKKINNEMFKENARRSEQGEALIPWEPIKQWQDGMLQFKMYCKGYRTSGVKDWFRSMFDTAKKFFNAIVDGCSDLIKKLTGLISEGEKINREIEDLNKCFG